MKTREITFRIAPGPTDNSRATELVLVSGGRRAYLWLGGPYGSCLGKLSGERSLRNLAEAILAELEPLPRKPRKEGQAKGKSLGFTIKPGEPRVIVFDDGGVRPASFVEVALWDALQAKQRKPRGPHGKPKARKAGKQNG